VITLRGERLGVDPGSNIVLLGDHVGRVTRTGIGQLDVEVPALDVASGGQVRVPVRVVVGSRVSQALDLSVSGDGSVAEASIPAEEPATRPTLAARRDPEPAPTRPAAPVVEALEPEPVPLPAASSAPPSTAPPRPRRPRPTPAPKATPAPPAAPVSSLLAEADTAASSGNHDAAVKLYDDVLKLEPGNDRAVAGKAKSASATASLRRRFVPGTTIFEGVRAGKAELRDFDTREVAIKKAPEAAAHIEFEVTPPRVKPGDSYTVRVYLLNDGPKPLKLNGLTLSTTVNGRRASGGAAITDVKEVPSRQRTLLHELRDVWAGDVTAWLLEAQVSSNRGDSYRNQVSWK
jgi:hypothetical protein